MSMKVLEHQPTLFETTNKPTCDVPASGDQLSGRAVEYHVTKNINLSLTILFRATGNRPDIWSAALNRIGPRRPTQARRAFRNFMSWDGDYRNQAMSALESAIDHAAKGRGEQLQDVISEYQLSPGLAHALFSCWPASDRNAINVPYHQWRNAVNKLVTKYQRLAFKLATQQQRRTGENEEWVSHAFFALIKAAEQYDDPHKATFMTFAYRWIQFELKKVSQREYENNRFTSLTLNTHSEATNLNRQLVDINQAKVVYSAISRLTTREQLVIRQLFGLNEHEQATTADQISRDLGVTRARIYQIKALAFSKLRQRLTI